MRLAHIALHTRRLYCLERAWVRRLKRGKDCAHQPLPPRTSSHLAIPGQGWRCCGRSCRAQLRVARAASTSRRSGRICIASQGRTSRAMARRGRNPRDPLHGYGCMVLRKSHLSLNVRRSDNHLSLPDYRPVYQHPYLHVALPIEAHRGHPNHCVDELGVCAGVRLRSSGLDSEKAGFRLSTGGPQLPPRRPRHNLQRPAEPWVPN